MRPFPWKMPNGQTVVDEMCACGAKRTQHSHRYGWGHGRCASTGCLQFTFTAFVFRATKGRGRPTKGVRQ